MRLIQKQAWAVDAFWIPNTLDYLESLSYTTDIDCDAEVDMILSKETSNKNPFDDCINVQKGSVDNGNKFKDVWEEIRAYRRCCMWSQLYLIGQGVNQASYEKKFKDLWEEINASAEILYVEPFVSRDDVLASQNAHGPVTLELLTADNEECGNKKNRKQSIPRRLLGRIKKIFGKRKIK